MIPLNLSVVAEPQPAFVTRLRRMRDEAGGWDSVWIEGTGDSHVFAGQGGVVVIEGADAAALDGDVILVDPQRGRAERLIRAGSAHNTLLVTERCDQLCIMCSQPPKKTHEDRFALLEQACLLAERDAVIGVTGGEPTLYKDELLGMIERVIEARPDLGFHVLTNAQHFDEEDVLRLRQPAFRRVTWGIPLYAAQADLHDRIVGKSGAFARLMESFSHLVRAGQRIELRTVLIQDNAAALRELARLVSARLRFVSAWSIMQLEHIGFARGRWASLYFAHHTEFELIAEAIDIARLHGIHARLFNFPLCTVPEPYRILAAPSISDWKRKYAPGCEGCREQESCSGFFEWHPQDALGGVTPL
ncbi:His-Xaa-Ser system radical SAM maturase HxsC [Sphingomonas sp. BGYR3]|uniref:His-Xaa-Ser system radical SAM maturase HxsC n=1 Tax=Sphingomonas sp. BGYR3 TaxID=2975483 RepID=UPI0021A3B83E|nr:His-Xaa-Ser system radical SAM maturase HxsC [Sphingomonas sp. BGYR3]MDG5488867.1 His-Xaa-Ser system radical SAM maturase HxsC [Sphingomonas sp. BGYR3]